MKVSKRVQRVSEFTSKWLSEANKAWPWDTTETDTGGQAGKGGEGGRLQTPYCFKEIHSVLSGWNKSMNRFQNTDKEMLSYGITDKNIL